MKKDNKILKKFLLILIIIVIVIFLIILICKIKTTFSKEKVVGNLSNNGLATENDDSIFYNKYENGIVKIKNGKEYQITNETAYSMSVVQDTIYYLTTSNSNGLDIKSVKTNGDSLNTITTIYTNLSKIYVKDGYIYYAISRNTDGICKINIETGEQNTISNLSVQDFVVDDNEIYFTDSINNLYKMNTNGLEVKKIVSDFPVKKIQILGKWIYFYSEIDDALCRVKKDGSSKTVISTFIKDDNYNLTSKNIYYFNSIDRKICKTTIKGNVSKEVVELKSNKTKINIVKGEIYYLDDSNDTSQIYQMYRVKENGKKSKNIEY